jgi:hypothetical protein
MRNMKTTIQWDRRVSQAGKVPGSIDFRLRSYGNAIESHPRPDSATRTPPIR